MEYVLIYADSLCRDNEVMLIRKARPECQKGRLNLVGGKVEPGESFLQAAQREFTEETGLNGTAFRRVGTIRSNHSDWTIGVFSCLCEFFDREKITSEPFEPVDWYDWGVVRNESDLMDNLRTAIPLIMAGMTGWTLIHTTLNYDNVEEEICSIDWEPANACV